MCRNSLSSGARLGYVYRQYGVVGFGNIRGQTLWFLAVALLMGVIALGRGIGFVIDGYDSNLLAPFLFEIVFVVVLVIAHRQLKAEG